MSNRNPGAADATASELPPSQYLTFALGREMFATDIRSIKEIIEYAGLTTVPMMPVLPMLPAGVLAA